MYKDSIWDPKDFIDAIERLPDSNHPLYNTDSAIEHLAHYRSVILPMAITPESYDLEERIFELNDEELILLEQTSFKRDIKNATYLELGDNISPTLYTILESKIKFDPNKGCRLRISTSRPPVFDSTPKEYDNDLSYIVFVERSYNSIHENLNIFRTDEVYLCFLTGEELIEIVS